MPDDPRAIARGLTKAEAHELRHRLSECENAARWYRMAPAKADKSDVIYLYETVALLGRAVAAALREGGDGS